MYVSTMKEEYEELGLPYRFVELLPDRCPTCGGLMEIKETLTGLHCENSRCPDKLVMRIKSICQDLNILGFGESTIEKFIEYYGVTNPLNMFALRVGMPLGEGVSDKVSESIAKQIEEKRRFQLWEYVRVANIPGIQTSAMAIFQGYKTLDKAYEDIENGGVEFIKKKLGLTGDENGISIRSITIYKNLMDYKEDLFESIGDVIIVDTEGLKDVKIVCSDQVGGRFKTKNEFYTFVKKEFGDKINPIFLTSVNKNIDYLIWAGADGSPARYTSKVKSVEGYNARGYEIPIMTAEEFIRELKDMC